MASNIALVVGNVCARDMPCADVCGWTGSIVIAYCYSSLFLFILCAVATLMPSVVCEGFVTACITNISRYTQLIYNHDSPPAVLYRVTWWRWLFASASASLSVPT